MKTYEITDGALCFTVKARDEASAKRKAEKVTKCGLSSGAKIIDITDEDADIDIENEEEFRAGCVA